jgi:NADPH-dependent curcumin reductase CurA
VVRPVGEVMSAPAVSQVAKSNVAAYDSGDVVIGSNCLQELEWA